MESILDSVVCWSLYFLDISPSSRTSFRRIFLFFPGYILTWRVLPLNFWHLDILTSKFSTSGYFNLKRQYKTSQFEMQTWRFIFRDVLIYNLPPFTVELFFIVWFLLRLRETRNALQLPVFLFFSLFSFFCQPYPEYGGIRNKKLFYRSLNT